MNELIFLVKGSAPEPYEVTFIKDGESLTALCSCPAGRHGNFCKHRLSILDGKPVGISSDNADDAAKITDWLRGTDVESALVDMRAVEKAGDTDKKELAVAKKRLARAMNS